MKKKASALVSSIMLVSVLAACGNNGGTNASGSTADQTTGAAPAAATEAADSTKQPEAVSYKLSLATAGDTNMTELQEQAIVPEFTKLYPGSEINVIGTGPGDAGSQKIFEKLKAQKDAGKTEWDIDLAIVHQSIMKPLLDNDLLEKWVPLSANKDLVISEDSKNSLGTNVDGYVVPLFHSQIALAYNPEMVKEVPSSYEALEQWIKDNPKRFGYNGMKNGMSGVGFATGYVYWKTNDYKQLAEGPYDAALEEKWPAAIKDLKALPTIITNGNNGTLDMLNRGEIDMGPVWVDMFYSWIAEGRLNPDYQLKMLDPGMPGQPMYIVVTKNAKNKDAAVQYADYLSNPETQAKVIVERNSWYPGIDANAVLEKASDEAKNKLFKYVTAEDLTKRSLSFPLADYLKNLQNAYEQQ